MKVIVDTGVWSLALRKANVRHDPFVAELEELLKEGRVQMIGPIRQEILSGVRSEKQFEMLRDRLRAFPDLILEASDYETAAEFYNQCREKGVQGSNTDYLICALSVRHKMSILTLDKDFEHYRDILAVTIHRPRSR